MPFKETEIPLIDFNQLNLSGSGGLTAAACLYANLVKALCQPE